MPVKIAFISDLHYGETPPLESRQGEFADVFLQRVVRRLNLWIKPGMVVVLGDCIETGDTPDGARRLHQMRAWLDKLACPWLVLRGNHDGRRDWFYRRMPKPAPWTDFGPYRLVALEDEDTPGFNAFRPGEMRERLRLARSGYNGRLIALQHMSLHPPGAVNCQFNLDNAAEVIADMRAAGVRLSVGGHFHKGFDLFEAEGIAYLGVPALCEAPFQFSVLELEGDTIRAERHACAMPRSPGLRDFHIHTPWAYCNENMDFERSIRLGELFGLRQMAFTEHSPHLYFDRPQMRSRIHFQAAPETLASGLAPRAEAYFEETGEIKSPFCRVGLEVECGFSGQPVVAGRHLRRCSVLLGAVHALPVFPQGPDRDRAEEEAFLGMLTPFLGCGINILAHPFRVFWHARKRHPEHLFGPVCRLLKQHGVAAELNFHTNTPPPAFFKLCLESGVKLSFGSDSHNLSQIGDFAPHLAFLKSIGYNGAPDEILWSE